MNTPHNIAEALLAPALAAPRKGRRRLVAIAGPPASGKSTISEALARAMCEAGCPTQVVPMDGFHLDNSVLSELGLLERKGAPETFDANGFLRMVAALTNEEQVYFPTFDRDRDIAIGGTGSVGPDCDTVLVEGNYLLFDAPAWRELKPHWDFSVWLNVGNEALKRRLVERWLEQGLSQEEAEVRAIGNDLYNADTIARRRLSSDVAVSGNAELQ
ncbi:AAA family ATPase [Cognatishimia activa]|uniref:AAA family ATPase n=1 Tax=Cognatishimia activa TaxID=1715691 RepID=UPI001FD81529|nr:AAA family ATPase [Cognatishimia activa]